jgi:acetyltransferase
MIRETRGFPMLASARGEPLSDISAVGDAILRVSQLVVDFPCISQMDINPLKVFRAGEGAKAVDTRISVSMDR